jgi:solute carrier family 50 protein (sugar transporter)
MITVIIVIDIFSVDKSHVRNILGLIGCVLSVAFFAAPLASVVHVFRTCSTECLPFSIIVTNFISSTLWWLYGLLIDDNYVKIPNFLGWLLASFQLLLFAYFPSKTTSGMSQHLLDGRSRKETLLNMD